MRRLTAIHRRWREVKMFAQNIAGSDHPILVQIVPIRRCNLACTYCNEYDKTSAPVATDVMLRRLDKLAQLDTKIITFSGGEPTLHPDLDLLIERVRKNGSIVTLITNGYFLTPERIKRLNDAGLDYLQISIDNVMPDDVSKKSLKVLDRKLESLSKYADFAVTINSVLGSDIDKPDDAFQIATRARSLGFNSTVGILHDGSGQLQPLNAEQQSVYEKIMSLGGGLFSFSHFDSFQQNVIRGLPNEWHCRAGGRFLYICEDGLVHYCSQQRGKPGIPLEQYTREDIVREAAKPKGCAPFCTISCVHQTAMMDDLRERPQATIEGIVNRRKEQDAEWRAPIGLRALDWMFLQNPARRDRIGKLALRVLGAKAK